jgi:hypothetical protein
MRRVKRDGGFFFFFSPGESLLKFLAKPEKFRKIRMVTLLRGNLIKIIIIIIIIFNFLLMRI